eukprot:NODE_81_length_22753_cov_0.207072.p3 type:complete len:751 gc:universal NODE_81_length_22753_cov_0.207072:18265-16013(-)
MKLHDLVLGNKDVELLQLLDSNVLDLWQNNEDGFTVFELASPSILKILNSYIKRQTDSCTRQCHGLVLSNDIQNVIPYSKHPLSKYVNWNSINNQTGQSMLHQCIINKNHDMLALLIPFIDVSIRNNFNTSIKDLELNDEMSKILKPYLVAPSSEFHNIKRGYLIKGKGIKAKKRFFELNADGVLSCYTHDPLTQESSSCRGILTIDELSIISKSNKEFHLCTPYFRWKLTANTELEAFEWKQVLEHRKQSKLSRSTSLLSVGALDSLDSKIYDCRDNMKSELELLHSNLQVNEPLPVLNLSIAKIRQHISTLDELFMKKDATIMKTLKPNNSYTIDALEESEDDEFFDAIERINLNSMAVPGYPTSRRQTLPVDHTLIKSNINVFGFLKDAIGQDLLHLQLPISFCEPSSLLHRNCEMLEYSYLLDLAVAKEDPYERLLLVTAFACSSYSAGINRANKPFDPLVGETFEISRPDLGFIGLCEQQSRIPSISACYFESKSWNMHLTSNVKTHFHGSHISVTPLGHAIVTLMVDNKQEVYTWQPVKALCNGIFTGSKWIDHFGVLTVTCQSSKLSSTVEFTPANWLRKNQYKIKGSIEDKWHISGYWNDHITCKRIDKEPNTFHMNSMHDNIDVEDRSTVLWHCTSMAERVPAYFYFTKFMIQLNEITDALQEYLPPTDTRLRQDLRAMENGDYVLAEKLLKEIEKKKKSDLGPRWFTKDVHSIAGIEYYKFDNDYWKCREQGFTDLPKMF